RATAGPQYVFEELKTPLVNGKKLRKRIRPLDYARNERVVYGYRDPESKLPSGVGVIKNVGEDVAPPAKKSKHVEQSEKERVEIHDTMTVNNESGEKAPRVLAIPRPRFKPIVEGNESTMISEAFGELTGWIKISAGADQQFNADPDQSKVFFVAKGDV